MTRALSKWAIGVFATPVGVVALAALDSTLFFSLPFGIDAVVVILAARLKGLAWVVPLLATSGAVAGAALTFWMGMKVGEKGLERYIAARRLKRIRERVRTSGAIALAALDLIPPPFPFTPFVLAAGALEVDTWRFFLTLAAARMFRFSVETALAKIYGRRILGWLNSDIFHDVVFACIIGAVALSVISLVRIVRSTRSTSRRAAA